MKLRYRCLVLDHDDTVVESSESVHYPAYLEVMRRLRPNLKPLSLQGWLLKNFDPGISSYFVDELAMNDDEFAEELRIWREYSTRANPPFFPGMINFLEEYQNAGGRLSIISHSEKEIIERNYRNRTDGKIIPDVVFGWDLEEGQRKPNPWPVLKTLELLSVERRDVLVVDDLKPAVLMARAAGVSIAAAGWGHDIPAIRHYMETNADTYLRSVDELRELVLGR